MIAAGGIADAAGVAAAIAAGADAVAVGTLLLRADEAGTSATHRAALADPARAGTVLTRAFSGRPARGIRNEFTDRYSAVAPYGYPALHYLTSPMRRAAAAAGDPERLHLWAGTGYRHATAEPAAAILRRLAAPSDRPHVYSRGAPSPPRASPDLAKRMRSARAGFAEPDPPPARVKPAVRPVRDARHEAEQLVVQRPGADQGRARPGQDRAAGQVGDPAARLAHDDRQRSEVLVALGRPAITTASSTPVSRPATPPR